VTTARTLGLSLGSSPPGWAYFRSGGGRAARIFRPRLESFFGSLTDDLTSSRLLTANARRLSLDSETFRVQV
jgi:hypothetical protein